VESFELEGTLGGECRSVGIGLGAGDAPVLFAIGEKKQFPVGEDAVDVEEKEFDFAGAGLRRKFCHRKDSKARGKCAPKMISALVAVNYPNR
jgi:hypothetical protein